ncbi:MAG: hypothetical protein NTV34_02795 [Proteobacteria bacterium]|nr:hypothetical protein [Pseudomonadota bacterium]
MNSTWKPHGIHSINESRASLPDSVYAFLRQQKEPLTDAAHVRNALARFDQVENVSDADRSIAFQNILKAAKYYGVSVAESDWRELMKTGNRSTAKYRAKVSKLR